MYPALASSFKIYTRNNKALVLIMCYSVMLLHTPLLTHLHLGYTILISLRGNNRAPCCFCCCSTCPSTKASAPGLKFSVAM